MYGMLGLRPTYKRVRSADGSSELVQDGWHDGTSPGFRFNPGARLCLKLALQANENIISIAQQFNTDHCTVLFWREKFGLGQEQPCVDHWPEMDED